MEDLSTSVPGSGINPQRVAYLLRMFWDLNLINATVKTNQRQKKKQQNYIYSEVSP